MTVLRLLLIFLTLIIVVLFSASFLLNVYDARAYLQEQLESHAQDTATSLGVSIAAVQSDDTAIIDSMIDAIFDRGYYQQIIFSDNNDKVLVNSEQPVRLEGIPNWFVNWINLNAPTATTEVNQGWVVLGKLSVTSHPGIAYRNLWHKTKSNLVLFGLVAAASWLALTLLLKLVLKPLSLLEKQAKAICEKQFEVQPQLPKTRDLRRVVEAMNRMAKRLQHLFSEQVEIIERLRDQSHRDHITGLPNRQAFDNRVNAWMESEHGESGGGLVLLQIRHLEQLNLEQGREAGDALIKQVAEQLTEVFHGFPGHVLSRRSGGDFAVFIPRMSMELLQNTTETLYRQLIGLQLLESIRAPDSLHVAAVLRLNRCALVQLLTDADISLRQLQSKGASGWSCSKVEPEQASYMDWSASKWHQQLKSILANKSLMLYSQQIYDNKRQLLQREVLARIQLENDIISAGIFLPMAERFGLAEEFDKLIVELVIQHVQQQTADCPYCVNLSPRSLQSEAFSNWLLDKFDQHRSLLSQLVFEVPEYCVQLALPIMQQLATRLSKLGGAFSIDHFGVGANAFAYLQSLSVHYLKVDSSYLKQLLDSKDNQFFIQSLVQIAHSRDITILAEGVEVEEVWQLLLSLGVDGGQGYLLHRPEAI
ncbi:bifunctional diguanylate cyclase/phosphodiesterase [Spartinivicinus poritis]|uniref:EAL domain-containing protein n=1 Tax=Spartinivicinus poritis TaxID=2994640 RepID=A0ABT5U4F6_9GAMM|nr:EAL domain-containing protein [Spartinivicinus sp. A2-2]MDE1461242.1 EAL domain-containing protein [Spartinivicinus sp. A2-2]